MSLDFPNPSRSYEPKKNRIRFWGYDRAIEITFFIQAETLMEICSDIGSEEAGLLEAFDSVVEQVRWAACRVYGRCRTFSYVHVLASDDFQKS